MGLEGHNFGRPFLVHHYYILSLSDLWLGVAMKIFLRNTAFLLYELYKHALPQEPLSGDHESYNFGRLFLGHHYNKYSLFDLCIEVLKMIFIGIMHFHYTNYMAELRR